MNIGEFSVRTPVISWLLVIIMLGGGLFAFENIGRLEDPNFIIKNAIVLIEEIDQQIAGGMPPYDAILLAGTSRLMPVALAATTTILGLIPLLSDVFFVNMSITIMVGLAFATGLTLIFVPVLYAILFNIKVPEYKTAE